MAELKTEAQAPIKVLQYNANSDRGWNDPPTLAFSGGSTAAPRRRIDLRKRVGHDFANTTLSQGVAGLQLASAVHTQPNGVLPPGQSPQMNGHYSYQNGYNHPSPPSHHPAYHHSASMPNLQCPTQEDGKIHSAAHAVPSNSYYWSNPSSGASTPLSGMNTPPTGLNTASAGVNSIPSQYPSNVPPQKPAQEVTLLENNKKPLFSPVPVFHSAVPTALTTSNGPKEGSPSSSPYSSGDFQSSILPVQTNIIGNQSQVDGQVVGNVSPVSTGPMCTPTIGGATPQLSAIPNISSAIADTRSPAMVVPETTNAAPVQMTAPPPKGLPPPARGYSPSSRNSRYPTGQTSSVVPQIGPSLSPPPPPPVAMINNHVSPNGNGGGVVNVHGSISHTRSSSLPNLPDCTPSPAAPVGPPPTGGYYAGRPSSARTSRDRTPSPAKLEPPVNISNDTDISDDEILELTTQKLYTCASCCMGQAPQKVLDDIHKRIQMFEQQWRTKVMSISVRTRMAELALALENGKGDDADRIHRSLIVDYPGEVSAWMVGIKKLISLMRELPGR